MRSQQKPTSAFTLMELMVVIIIVGVIATLALVKYNELVNYQKYRLVLHEMKLIHSACKIYYIKHGDFPHDGTFSIPLPSGYGYMDTNRFFKDIGYTPSDTSEIQYWYYYGGGYTNIRAFIRNYTYPNDLPGSGSMVWTWLNKPLQTDTANPVNDNPDCERGSDDSSVPCP